MAAAICHAGIAAFPDPNLGNGEELGVGDLMGAGAELDSTCGATGSRAWFPFVIVDEAAGGAGVAAGVPFVPAEGVDR